MAWCTWIPEPNWFSALLDNGLVCESVVMPVRLLQLHCMDNWCFQLSLKNCSDFRVTEHSNGCMQFTASIYLFACSVLMGLSSALSVQVLPFKHLESHLIMQSAFHLISHLLNIRLWWAIRSMLALQVHIKPGFLISQTVGAHFITLSLTHFSFVCSTSRPCPPPLSKNMS